jgi:hypothetical protein
MLRKGGKEREERRKGEEIWTFENKAMQNI